MRGAGQWVERAGLTGQLRGDSLRPRLALKVTHCITPAVSCQKLANVALLPHFAVIILIVLGLPAVHIGNLSKAPRLAAGRLRKQETIMDTSLISQNPEIMSGALCFTGTRVLVKNLFDYLEGASSLEDFLEDFPSVSREKAVAVLEAARERLSADALAA